MRREAWREVRVRMGMRDTECRDLRMEIDRIRGKYSDTRKRSWNREHEEALLKETLKKEKTIEEIVRMIGDGEFTVSECADILSEAQKRINIFTPVRITDRNQDILLEVKM